MQKIDTQYEALRKSGHCQHDDYTSGIAALHGYMIGAGGVVWGVIESVDTITLMIDLSEAQCVEENYAWRATDCYFGTGV